MTLTLENVSKSVGPEDHLVDIDLTFRPGSLYVLFGLTLAGKTSLMRLMASLDRPTRGRVLVDGKDVTDFSVRERSVAMVYQQFINYPAFTVYDNIASPLRIRGLAKTLIDEKVRETAALVRIDHLLDRLPAELSGGQQQRVAIARALIKEADLLLLDEPLVNLDYKLREEMRDELKSIFRTGKSIVVYATTEPAEALLLGGDTVVIDQGRVLQSGPTLEVFHHPASVRVTQVFSEPPMNLIDGAVADGRFTLDGGIEGPLPDHLADVADGRYRLGFRANHVALSKGGDGEIEISATADLAEVSGSETFIHLKQTGADWVVQEKGVHSLRIGEPIKIYLRPDRLFLFGADGLLKASPPVADAMTVAA
ncbi:MAG: ABC transporter ATP-binding protein [Alphaproteobacteria bacterium]|nr:ABC transporter ATP-binding protein [Alphaproteobacteria bacterium]